MWAGLVMSNTHWAEKCQGFSAGGAGRGLKAMVHSLVGWVVCVDRDYHRLE